MRRMIKKAALLFLAFSIVLTITPVPAHAAVSSRDSYYLSVLKPNPMPRAKESFPAKLKVDLAHPMLSANVEFTGNIGVNAEITDEELFGLLKASLPAVSGYKELQDPVDDKVLVKELTEKLKFSQEDVARILDNWKTLSGFSDIIDILMGKIPLPSTDAQGVAGVIVTAAEGEIPGLPNIKPSMPGTGTVVDGIFISYVEYKIVQERYEKIVTLSKTKERLRAYNAELFNRIRYAMTEKGGWALVINSQDTADLTYNEMPGLKQLWTADIDLRRSDGGDSSIVGVYTGIFKLSMNADMLAYDDGYDDFYAQRISTNAIKYVSTGNEGPMSEIKLAYEIHNCRMTIALPDAKNFHLFEESIPYGQHIKTGELTQTEFTVNSDRAVEVTGTLGASTVIVNWHVVENNGYYEQTEKTTTIVPGVPTQTNNNPSDVGMMDWPPDTTGNVTMTLVIDMLAGR